MGHWKLTNFRSISFSDIRYFFILIELVWVACQWEIFGIKVCNTLTLLTQKMPKPNIQKNWGDWRRRWWWPGYCCIILIIIRRIHVRVARGQGGHFPPRRELHERNNPRDWSRADGGQRCEGDRRRVATATPLHLDCTGRHCRPWSSLLVALWYRPFL